MFIINVLKQFTFSVRPPSGRNGAAVEKVFHKGEHEIPEEMAAHPFISEHFADGCIERPEQAKARAEAAAVKAQQTAEEAARVNRLAEAAVARLTAQAATTTKASKEEIERELNTPVNLLKTTQGGGIDPAKAATDEAAAKAAADAVAAEAAAKVAAEAAAKQAEADAVAKAASDEAAKKAAADESTSKGETLSLKKTGTK
jgi:hypothetical protein